MGLIRIRKDSVKELRRRKSLPELQRENEELRARLEEQEDALIELAALLSGEEA